MDAARELRPPQRRGHRDAARRAALAAEFFARNPPAARGEARVNDDRLDALEGRVATLAERIDALELRLGAQPVQVERPARTPPARTGPPPAAVGSRRAPATPAVNIEDLLGRRLLALV